jgi:hypothetical protein
MSDQWNNMHSRLFKNHSGKAPGKFGAEVYCLIHEVSKFSAATPPEGEFQQPFRRNIARFGNCSKTGLARRKPILGCEV